MRPSGCEPGEQLPDLSTPSHTRRFVWISRGRGEAQAEAKLEDVTGGSKVCRDTPRNGHSESSEGTEKGRRKRIAVRSQ